MREKIKLSFNIITNVNDKKNPSGTLEVTVMKKETNEITSLSFYHECISIYIGEPYIQSHIFL